MMRPPARLPVYLWIALLLSWGVWTPAQASVSAKPRTAHPVAKAHRTTRKAPAKARAIARKTRPSPAAKPHKKRLIFSKKRREQALVTLDNALDSFLNGQRDWNEKIMEYAAGVPEARLENDSLHLPRRSVASLPSAQVRSMLTYHDRAFRKYEQILQRYPRSEREGARMAYPFAPIRVVLDP